MTPFMLDAIFLCTVASSSHSPLPRAPAPPRRFPRLSSPTMLLPDTPRRNSTLPSPPPSPPPRYAASSFASRSTARVGEAAAFAEDAAARRARLHAELDALGFTELEPLLHEPAFRGSAALRMYTSFLFPKSAGALAMAEKPHRAATVAASICFMVREQRAAAHEWLRNHDRALSEGARQGLPRHPLYIVLDNLRSAANVGNIFRAAEAARVSEVLTCGITPTPPDPKLLKTAVGAAKYVKHSHFSSTAQAVAQLQARGIAVWAVETTENAKLYCATDMPQPVALVFGNEVIGVDTDVLHACDAVVDIPMHGVKNSLNVATAASILIWEALRQWSPTLESSSSETS